MTLMHWRPFCLFVPAAFVMLGAGAFAVAADEQHSSGGNGIARQSWPFAGFRGQYDTAQLQRGFQVYQQSCSACHGLKRVYFRNLAQPGGPQFPEDSVKALAASWPNQITDGPDDSGKMVQRPARLSDPILGPYKNDNEARAAQNGALPPDLSIIAKARGVHNDAAWPEHVVDMLTDVLSGYQEGGPDYLYALLTGYQEPPPGLTVVEGLHYNTAFPGYQIAMPPPLSEGSVIKYQENAGAVASLEQNAKDVAAFLVWASDPTLNERKRIGWQVMLYLLVTVVLLYFAKKRIWSRIKR